MIRKLILLTVLLFASPVIGQDQVLEGPVRDRLTARLQARIDAVEKQTKAYEIARAGFIKELRAERAARLQAEKKAEQAMQGLIDRFSRDRQGLLEQVRREREKRFELINRDREGIFSQLREASAQRKEIIAGRTGIFQSIKEARSDRLALRGEAEQARKGFLDGFRDAAAERRQARKERGTLANRLFWACIYIGSGVAFLGLVCIFIITYVWTKVKPLLP